MPVLYTHLIPATFGGRARMNVANALAAAAAAWAAGAHLHDIRQGLRTFSTSFFQAPGRLNLLEVGGVRVVIDYCHNVDGMRQLADFVERMMGEPEARPGAPPSRAPGAPQGPATTNGTGRAKAGRSASSASRATGATRTSASTARSRRPRSTRSSSARTRTCAAAQPGETAANVVAGVKEARAGGHRAGRSRRREDPRRDDRRPGGAPARRTRATSS